MPIYRITENNVTVAEYEADKIEILPSGQFVLFNRDINIGVFNQNCSCFSVDDFYKNERELISEEISKISKEIHNIDNRFGTDVFFEEKTPEFANEQLRKISGILYHFGWNINLKKD